VEQQEHAPFQVVQEHLERPDPVHRRPPRGPGQPEAAHLVDGVRVEDVVVEERRGRRGGGVGAPRERARERRVLAEERLVVPPLLELEQLRAPMAAERAGDDQAGDGVLQRPAPDLADGLAAGRASPLDVNEAGIAHDVPVLALPPNNKHTTNEESVRFTTTA